MKTRAAFAFLCTLSLGSSLAEPLGSSSASVSEWTQIRPGADTGCAFNTEFTFFYRAGPDPSKLLIYFEGGGACWEWVSCSGMSDSSVSNDEVSPFAGIFDFSNAANPMREYSIVFIPYCTGDVHIGDTIQHYGDPGRSIRVAHLGYRNVEAVFGWLSTRLAQAPSSVIISGTSAGAYGALFYAPRVAEIFPAATLALIGDSGVPLLKDYPVILRQWGTPKVLRRIRKIQAELTQRDLTLESAHQYFASQRPSAALAVATSDRDAIQSAFYVISGSPRARAATYALLDELERTIPRFYGFVVAGSDHGLFVTNRFYSYSVDGVSLVDWLRGAVSGRNIGSHRCEACR